jgi:hypothetical protein
MEVGSQFHAPANSLQRKQTHVPSAQQTVWDLQTAIGKVKLSLCLTNYALRHEGLWGVDV